MRLAVGMHVGMPVRWGLRWVAAGAMAWVALSMLGACGDIVVPHVGPDGYGGLDTSACDPVACDDKDPCTTDTCGADGQCQHEAKPDSCAIDGVCHGAGDVASLNACKVCDPSRSRTDWSDLSCDDDNPCTADSCDANAGCHSTPDDSRSCDDGDPCTAGETCTAGTCGGGSVAPPDCGTAVCGQDACGSLCGDCAAGQTCNAGVCEDPQPQGCGDITDVGCCGADGQLRWCQDETIQFLDCAASNSVCGWSTGAGYFDCGTHGEPAPADMSLPYLCPGDTCTDSCDGKACGYACGVACGPGCDDGQYCTLDGQCANCSCGDKVCGTDECGNSCGTCDAGEACTADGTCAFDVCSDEVKAQAGCCDGTVIMYCTQNGPFVADCADQGLECGWVADGGWYDCGGTGEDPSGANPIECTPTVPTDPGPETEPDAGTTDTTAADTAEEVIEDAGPVDAG